MSPAACGYLLDTHVLLWAAAGVLAGEARELIAERADEVHVSAATVSEIEVKRALGRLQAREGGGPETELASHCDSTAGSGPPSRIPKRR